MCFGCWQEDGAPRIDNPKVRELAEAIKAADHYGPLHIVVDDNNYDDDSVRWCRYGEEGYQPEPFETWEPEDRRCWELLMAATEAERISADALASGYWSPDAAPSQPGDGEGARG